MNRLFRMIAALILMSCCSMSAFASQGVYLKLLVRGSGKWSVDRKTLIVEGVVDRVFGNGLFWFKLALDDSGVKLQGIRRLVSDNQSSTRSGGPCFSDFEVNAA